MVTRSLKKKKKKKKNPHVRNFKLIGTGDWGLSGVTVNMEQGM